MHERPSWKPEIPALLSNLNRPPASGTLCYPFCGAAKIGRKQVAAGGRAGELPPSLRAWQTVGCKEAFPVPQQRTWRGWMALASSPVFCFGFLLGTDISQFLEALAAAGAGGVTAEGARSDGPPAWRGLCAAGPCCCPSASGSPGSVGSLGEPPATAAL